MSNILLIVSRDLIINAIKHVYFRAKNTNCPVFHVQTNTLKAYTLTEKEFKKGQSKMPPGRQRNYDEDLFKIPSQRRMSIFEHKEADLDGEELFPETRDEWEDKIARRRN